MDTSHAHRRKRLQELVDSETEGNAAAFARKHDQDAARLRQLLNENYRGGKGFGENVARRLEKDLGLSPFYFDKGLTSTAHHISAFTESENKRQTAHLFTESGSEASGKLSEINTEPGPDTKGKLPLISWSQAATWEAVVENFAPGDAEDWLFSPINASEHAYYLRVKGESMLNPGGGEYSFKPGDLILVEPGNEAESGDLVIVRLNDEAEATFKQLFIEGGRKYLKALNPAWPNRIMEVNGNATICGIVMSKTEVYQFKRR